jgi:hypothetical protein
MQYCIITSYASGLTSGEQSDGTIYGYPEIENKFSYGVASEFEKHKGSNVWKKI